MRIVSYRGPHRSRAVVHVDGVPLDPARIGLVGDTVVISLMTDWAEWRISLDRRDVGILGGALARLTGSAPA